jgi:hypothetical protein
MVTEPPDPPVSESELQEASVVDVASVATTRSRRGERTGST